MKILKGEFRSKQKEGNFLFSKRVECRVRRFDPLDLKQRLSKRKIRAWRRSGVSLFKLNQNVFYKPRKPEKKPKEIKRQPLIGNKLRDLFRFKNLKDTAAAFSTSEANLNNLNTGKAGDGISNAYRAIIAFAGGIAVQKRKKILANINFDEMFSNV